MEAAPFDAIGRVPGEHLGLSWTGVEEADLPDIRALLSDAETADDLPVHTAEECIRPMFLPTSAEHHAMVGRDSAGGVRAAGSVRLLRRAGVHTVAIVAAVSPSWRGRGIGRAVLAWQDAWGVQLLLGHPHARGRITTAIPARMTERRRLQTAAGFSSTARLEHYCKVLGDAPAVVHRHGEPDRAPKESELRPLQPQDLPALVAFRNELPADPDSVCAISFEELVRLADPAISWLVMRSGTLGGGLLAHRTTDRQGRAVAVIDELLLEPHDAALGTALISTAWRRMWEEGLAAAHLRLTPRAHAQWQAVLRGLACTPIDADFIYGIEVP